MFLSPVTLAIFSATCLAIFLLRAALHEVEFSCKVKHPSTPLVIIFAFEYPLRLCYTVQFSRQLVSQRIVRQAGDKAVQCNRDSVSSQFILQHKRFCITSKKLKNSNKLKHEISHLQTKTLMMKMASNHQHLFVYK